MNWIGGCGLRANKSSVIHRDSHLNLRTVTADKWVMNQRDRSVAITVFGEPDMRIRGRIRNISGRGIGLETEVPVAAGTALKVELDDGLLLGEVIYCRADGPVFYVGVELEHALCGLGELSLMVNAYRDAFEPAESRAQRGHSVVERGHQGQQQPH
uniref:Type IV pilus assembly PilZ n=1 Tax=Solibacter usitatus (strain Ellin6076) TaxID=234267 RepID=Q01SY4_SOLUE